MGSYVLSPLGIWAGERYSRLGRSLGTRLTRSERSLGARLTPLMQHGCINKSRNLQLWKRSSLEKCNFGNWKLSSLEGIKIDNWMAPLGHRRFGRVVSFQTRQNSKDFVGNFTASARALNTARRFFCSCIIYSVLSKYTLCVYCEIPHTCT